MLPINEIERVIRYARQVRATVPEGQPERRKAEDLIDACIRLLSGDLSVDDPTTDFTNEIKAVFRQCASDSTVWKIKLQICCSTRGHDFVRAAEAIFHSCCESLDRRQAQELWTLANLLDALARYARAVLLEASLPLLDQQPHDPQ